MTRIFLPVLGIFILLQIACTTPAAAVDVVSSIQLAGYQVMDLKGDTIAQLEDILIAPDSGRISYALVILERGPFNYGKAALVDASIPRTAVPWECFQIDSESMQLQFQADRSVLYASPLLEEKPNHLEAGWDADIRAYWQAYPLPTSQE